jgi:hypothetical protein
MATPPEERVKAAAIRLLAGAPGAANLADLGRIRGRDWTALVAEEAGLPLVQVQAIVARRVADVSATFPVGS